MIAFLRSLWRSKTAPLPKIGERYELEEVAPSPFDEKPFRVTVVDVRKGWVQYTYTLNGIRWSLPCSTFNSIYRLIPAEVRIG